MAKYKGIIGSSGGHEYRALFLQDEAGKDPTAHGKKSRENRNEERLYWRGPASIYHTRLDPGWGLNARLMILLCKKKYSWEIQRSENQMV
jgi:hypothetical protein